MRKIKSTLKKGMVLGLVGGTFTAGTAVSFATSMVSTYADTISDLTQVTVSDGWYTIANASDESYVLDIASNSSANNANLQLYKSNNTNAQKFYIESIGNNEYKIKTGSSSGNKVLNAVNADGENGDNVNQYSYYSSKSDEKWKIYQDGSGNYVFVSSTSKAGGAQVLDITSNKVTSGTNIQLYQYNKTTAQKWKLKSTSYGSSSSSSSSSSSTSISSLTQVSVSDGWYTIANAKDESFVLDIASNSSANNANLQLYKSNNTNAQKFYIESIGNNEYKIKTGSSSGNKVLNAVNGDNVNQYSYNSAINDEKWKIYQDSSGNYIFMSSTGDKVLDIASNKLESGTNIQLYQYNNTTAQKWKLKSVSYGSSSSSSSNTSSNSSGSSSNNSSNSNSGSTSSSSSSNTLISSLTQTTVSDGWYTIANSSNKSFVLDIASGDAGNSANVQLYKSNDTNAQKFYIESIGNNEYKIKTGASLGARVLNAQKGDNSNGDNVNQYTYDSSVNDEKWKIYQDGSGNYVIMSSTGDKVLDIASNKVASGTNIQLYDYNGTSAQKWALTATTKDTTYKQDVANGAYTITLASNNNYTLDVSGNKTTDGTKIQLYSKNSTSAQIFRIQYVGNGEYTINTGASFYDSNIDVRSSNITNASIVQWSSNNTKAQRWRIIRDGDSYIFQSTLADDLVLEANGTSSGSTITLGTYTDSSSKTQRFQLTKSSTWYINGDRKYYFGENGNKPEVGIDISYHQGTIDWDKVKADGISYAIIRVGYRSDYNDQPHRGIGTDSQYQRNISECERLGIPYGVYFYSAATTNDEADQEAAAILSAISGKNPTLGVYIDIEASGVYENVFGSITSSSARRSITNITKRICNTVKNAGYSVGVYANQNYFENVLYASELEGYMWVARYYTNTPTDTRTFDVEGSSTKYKYWQYSSVGTVNGISGNVDMNTTVR